MDVESNGLQIYVDFESLLWVWWFKGELLLRKKLAYIFLDYIAGR